MAERKERRDAAEHRRIILQQAKSLFAEHGVESVSMHQIARSAGVGQGTLYRRYAHKGDLCLDIIEESFRQLNDEIERYLQKHRELPVRQRLEHVLRQWLDFVEDKSRWLGELQPRGCDMSYVYNTPLYQSMHGIIRGLLEEAVERQGAAPVDPVFAADAMLACMSPYLQSFLRNDRGYSKETLAQCMFHLYLDPVFEGCEDAAK